MVATLSCGAACYCSPSSISFWTAAVRRASASPKAARSLACSAACLACTADCASCRAAWYSSAGGVVGAVDSPGDGDAEGVGAGVPVGPGDGVTPPSPALAPESPPNSTSSASFSVSSKATWLPKETSTFCRVGSLVAPEDCTNTGCT